MLQRPEDAIIKIEGVLDKARDARSQLEADVFNLRTKGGGYEFPQAALEGFLRHAETLLEVALEASGLSSTRIRLIEKWESFEKQKQGIGKTIPFGEADFLESQPLDYLEKVVEGMRIALGQTENGWEAYELKKLESLLRKTAKIVRGEGVVPRNEHDIQTVMTKYLDAAFAEHVTNVNIPGGITSFKPDGGIRSLKAAIEFKYAATRDEVSRSLRGIFEDVSGYKGSADWTRFFSVVYQTEAFESEEKFGHDLNRAAAIDWTPILVTGKGTRRKTRPRRQRKPSVTI
jgi:hypothetical protein